MRWVNLPVVSPGVPLSLQKLWFPPTDFVGRILYCNRMFVEVSGYAGEELLGQPTTSCGTRTCLKRRTATCGKPSAKAFPGRHR